MCIYLFEMYIYIYMVRLRKERDKAEARAPYREVPCPSRVVEVMRPELRL